MTIRTKLLFAAGALLFSGVLNAGTILIDQRAGLITGVGTGPTGADQSMLQDTSQGLTIFGFGHATSTGFRVADDVTFPTEVDINTITVYTYQTGSTTTPTITGFNLQIWGGGAPNAGGTIVFGDTTTNRFGGATFTNIYRTLESAPGNAQRPIMAVTSIPLNLTLPAGTYWIDYSLAGSLASGPWAVPLTTLGANAAPGANGLQWNGTAWGGLLDGTIVQGVAFTIEGEGVPLPDELFLHGFEDDPI